ncbi:MAG: tetratricopeptide repeat protein, partial [Nitrospirota bacterium]|nr:tetratricopeptide repeat protein [Nitrospirota bacterium]
MSEPTNRITAAILAGNWETVRAEAAAWVREPDAKGQKDPRPSFALNVVHLLRGEFKEAWKTHAASLEAAEDIEQVRTWVDALLKEHPDQANVHLVGGLFLSQSGRSEESVARYKEAIRLDPRSAYPHYFLAQIHERAGRPEMAIKAYREAIRLDATFAQARTNLGVVCQNQGQIEMAIPQYREVLKLNPDDAVAHANLACALAEQGKIEPAILEYKEAIRLNPRDAEVH